MRIARITSAVGRDRLVVNVGSGWFPVDHSDAPEKTTGLADIVGVEQLRGLVRRVESNASVLDAVTVEVEHAATIADRNTDIWGAGLNYRQHSEDLEAAQPSSGPGSYLRPASCLIGNGQPIELPVQTNRVTAEAELGLIVGTGCKNVRQADWRSVIAGVTGVLDMTAEDVIRENPRYIPWAKGFDTFCSIGPLMVTLDEFDAEALNSLQISTIRNGETIASAPTSSMKYDLGYLVEYFTAGRTLAPGTVICTGTPGAAVISAGDTVSSVVEHVGTLTHHVR